MDDVNMADGGKQPKKKNKILISVLIGIAGVVILAVIVFGAVFLPKYFRHKNFSNGMTGEYICIDTTATLIAQGSGITDDWLDENFLNKTTLTIDDNGKIELSDIKENLRLENSSFNMGQILNNRYVLYETDGGNTKNVGIHQLYYYKKGLQWSADKYCDKDRLKVYMWVKNVDADYAFVMTFEKTDD